MRHETTAAMPADVAAVFDEQPQALRANLLRLREIIFEVAAETDGVGPLDETLRWGQPSYLTTASGSGSTIRIDAHGSGPNTSALYVTCHTNLVERFRLMAPELVYDGNRAIVFDGPVREEEPVRECIAQALTYHLRKR